MPFYRNTDTHRRVWMDVTRPDGSTLELAPGEVGETSAPVTSPYLQTVPPPKTKTAAADAAATSKE